jgi:hypothetical protein
VERQVDRPGSLVAQLGSPAALRPAGHAGDPSRSEHGLPSTPAPPAGHPPRTPRGPQVPHSTAPGFSWTRDCERILAGGVSRWGKT